MKVKIEFEVPKGDLSQLVDYLRVSANRIEMADELGWGMPTKVMDINGNSIGQIEVSDAN